MILVTGSAQLKPEMREQAIEIGCAHSSRSRAEPGCLVHNCMVDAEDDCRLIFYEEWEDMDALRTHFGVVASGEFVRKIAELAVSAPQIRIFEADPVESTPF